MSLTDTSIKALKPSNGRYEATDRDGLLLEVHPSGRKVWRYRYRLGGKREKLTIGPYPAIGLKEARSQRDEAERQVVVGESPAKIRQRSKAFQRENGQVVVTVSKLATSWIETVLRPASKNAKQDETYWQRDLQPVIGAHKPEEVTPADIWNASEAVLKRGHPQAARRVRNVAKRLFDYGISKGIVRVNPAASVRAVHLAPAHSRTQILKNGEVKSWLNQIYTSRLNRRFKLALHLLLLVPVRKGELINARKDNFDLAKGLWDIPAENSKMGTPIRHLLPRQALELVTELFELSGNSDWLIPSTHGRRNGPVSKTALNGAFRTIDGISKDLVIHDLRRTVRTGLSELGNIPTEVAELCLNHRPKGVHGIYDRSERLPERAIALQRWADQIDELRK